MKFPDVDEFLEVLGVEPVEWDESTLMFRYSFGSVDDSLTVEVSFSVVMKSFQVKIFMGGREISMASTEGVGSIELISKEGRKGIHAKFGVEGLSAEAIVIVEPELACRWWSLCDR